MSMGVYSTGNNYGIAEDIIYSFPIICEGGDWQVIEGLSIAEFSQKQMRITEQELLDEKKAISDLI